MRKLGFPDAPFVLGIILGPMIDENMRRGLILSNGNFGAFFHSPISLVLVAFTALTLFANQVRFVTQGITRGVKSLFGSASGKSAGGA
jgi:putative tricarboxylic transport membrane protein